MKNFLRLLLTAAVAVTLSACASSDDQPPMVAATDLVVQVSANTTAGVVNSSFTFANGVLSFGTTSTTTVTFSNTATTPAFSIVSAGKTATGTTSFGSGSCIFTVTASNFESTSPLALNQAPITISPCNFVVLLQGAAANGQTLQRFIELQLGNLFSSGVLASVVVNPDGSVTLNSRLFGTVTLVPSTGGSGAG